MYLSKVDSGHKFQKKLFMKLIQVIGGAQAPDSLKALLYRPEFFGSPESRMLQATMRTGSEWSSAEREIMATFVSERSSCRFCTSVHRAVAGAVCDVQVVDAALNDLDKAPISEQLRATLRLLEKLAVNPDSLQKSDIVEARTSGVTDEQLRNAFYICFTFAAMNRVMDGLGAPPPSNEQLRMLAKVLHSRGYEV
jgi:uncharacterized peroxidase-related enzyme